MSLHIWFFVLLLGVVQFGLSYVFLSRGLDAVSPVTASLTSTIEPILNPILVAVFYGETIGATAVIGALLVVGSATVYNVRQAKTLPESVQKAGRSHTKGTKRQKIYEQPVKYLLKKEIAEQKVSCYNNF